MPYIHETALIDAYKKLYMLGRHGGKPYGNSAGTKWSDIPLAVAPALTAMAVNPGDDAPVMQKQRLIGGRQNPYVPLIGGREDPYKSAAAESDVHEQARNTKIAGSHTASSFKESEKRASDMGHDINVGRFLIEQGMAGSYPGTGTGRY